MNVRDLFSKWLFALLIVVGIFAIGSADVFALDIDGNTGKTEEYTVIEWRKNKADNDDDPSTTYIEKHYYNKDILCSSSTRSQNTTRSSVSHEQPTLMSRYGISSAPQHITFASASFCYWYRN